MTTDVKKPRIRHRNIWGAAYRAGLQDAGIKNIEEFMSAAQRLKNIETNLPEQAKKVLLAMPIGEEVTTQQVIRTLTEGGKNVALHALQRNLLDLIESTLIRKVRDDVYMRRAIEEPRTVSAPVQSATAVAAPSGTPLDRLTSLAQKLRNLASEIEDTILEAEEYVQDIRAETGKFEQLKQLLKTL